MNERQGSDAQRLQCRAPWLLSARSNSFFEAKGDYATRLAPNSAKTHEVKIRDEDETSCVSDVFFDCVQRTPRVSGRSQTILVVIL